MLIKTNYEKFFKRLEYQTTLPAFWEICMQVNQQQLEMDMGKEYIVKAVYCLPAYLTYAEYIMKNTGLDEAQARIKITGRNVNNFRYANDNIFMAKSEKELRNHLMKMKEESGKAGLKLNIQKTMIMASGPITSWQIDGEQWKQWWTLFSWTPKSLQMVTAAVNLKDACSLEEKLWPT